jgi:hypothetical protein
VPEHTQETEILQLNQRLLDAIAAADWATYEELCDPQQKQCMTRLEE